ncbi:MAG: endolytic transglycosylase MltG, partial [Betaproteobacteria bacterium]|nr:endolytic transglycosylase MltG [Betaproteobacteria bacterium]
MLWFKRVIWLAAVLLAAFAAWFVGYGFTDLAIDGPLQFGLKHGSSLRGAAHQMQAAGVIRSPRQFELLARIYGVSNRIQAGNYELGGAITPVALLRKITSRDRTQDRITFVEGW